MTDPDDPALVSKRDLAGVTRYHLAEDCPNAPDDTREGWSIAQAERRGLSLCRRCDPETPVEQSNWSRPLRALVEDDDVDLSEVGL